MVDNIMTHGDQAAFVAGRGQAAWHKLGKVFEDLLTLDDALAESHLANWNVRAVPLTAKHNGDAIEVPGKRVVLRDNPFVDGQVDALGVVGERYTEVQNEEAFAFGENILDASSSVIDTMGALGNGSVVFSTLVMPETITIDGEGANDTIKYYLVVFTSHDGTKPTTALLSPTRVVCQNTLSVAVGNAKVSFKVRHTSGVEGRLHDAKEALKISYAHSQKFEDEVRKLYETPMTVGQFYNVYTDLDPRPEVDTDAEGEVINKASLTRWDNKYEFISGLFTGGNDEVELDTIENIRGTAWAGLNAFTEYEDWYRQVRGDNGEENRLTSTAGIDGSRSSKKATVLKRFSQFADENKKIVVPV